ncbi:MAG: M23 family metallopeptidase [Bacteroidales bacterium]|nr:M23 family metallopeptidase [Bacteroidales bacterium]
MVKKKYRLNPTSLKLEEVKHSWRDRMKKFGWHALTGTVFAIVAVFVVFAVFPSPRERMLERELEHTRLKYNVMNERLIQIEEVLADLENRDDDIYRVIFEAEPIPDAQRKAGYGGAERYKDLQGYSNSELLTQTAKRLDRISRRLYVQSKSFDEVIKMARNKDKMLNHIPAIQPINNKNLTRIASGFGYRIHPVYKTLRMHEGMDFTAPTGTPVYATGDGRIVKPRNPMSGYGRYVLIDHKYGYQTLYAHMSKVIVRRGQKIKRGEIIGYVGNTGVSTGPHLHYEVRKNDKPVNPVHFFYNDLTPEEYEKVIEISSQVNQALS